MRLLRSPKGWTGPSVTDHWLRSRHYINVIISGKQPALQYLNMDAAIKHCTTGLGIWEWASSDRGSEPDVVMACAGDIPTLKTLAAVDLLRQHFPDLKVRVVNVVDLMVLQPQNEHPHGLPDKDFDSIFTTDKPIIVKQSATQQSPENVGFRSSNATCFKSGNPPNAMAPQPTHFKVFGANPSVLGLGLYYTQPRSAILLFYSAFVIRYSALFRR